VSNTAAHVCSQHLHWVCFSRTSVNVAGFSHLLNCPLSDLTFILVSTPRSIFAAHGTLFLIVSPVIEGLLGGWSTLQGATSAYISDCTSDGSRAQIFSRFTGVFYLGFSLGPALGAYLIRHPVFSLPSASSGPSDGQSSPVTSVFYVAAMASFVNLLLVFFIFPESLGKKKAKAGLQRAVVNTIAGCDNTTKPKKQSLIKRFFDPLTLFAPKKVVKQDGAVIRDWSLTVLATSFFLYLLAMVSVSIR
jgi:hypothetical protein